jgi:hypothetical protein
VESHLSFSDLTITNDGANTLIDDKHSDFAIKLAGVKDLGEGDFIL